MMSGVDHVNVERSSIATLSIRYWPGGGSCASTEHQRRADEDGGAARSASDPTRQGVIDRRVHGTVEPPARHPARVRRGDPAGLCVIATRTARDPRGRRQRATAPVPTDSAPHASATI